MGISSVEIIKLSCFTYIYLKSHQELVVHMVIHIILHKTCRSLNMICLTPCNSLRYKDGDIRVMLVSNCGFIEILVLRFVIPVACTYGLSLCDEVGA